MPIATTIRDKTFASPQGRQAYRIVEELLDAGFDAHFVGGCVRDMLRNTIPTDIDIATSAKPEEVTALFKKYDDRSAKFGSVLVSLEGKVFEVTTYREDDESSDGRHPESITYSTIEKDAERRDITINAMYWNPISGILFDPYEGEKDLAEGLVHFIGMPEVRIKHDALRMLRAVRFRALINGQYHPETFRALHMMAEHIRILSGDRFVKELEGMLTGPHPEIAFEDLWETDILEYMLPELHKCKGIPQPADYHKEGDVWNHTMQAISTFTEDHNADVRWAALFHDCGKAESYSLQERIRFDEHASHSAEIAKKVFSRLQMPNARSGKICWLIRHHMMMGSFFEMNENRKAHWYYHPWFVELLQLFWIDIAGTTPSDFSLYDRIIDDYNKYLDAHPRPPQPLLNGEEVMEILGIQPGEKVGEILKELYDKQLTKEITSKKEAINYLRSH